MPNYSFQTLSPIDFENLVRDLLQSQLSVRLESFKAGKDFGIALRYSKSKASGLIIQAKHYSETGFKGLLSDLKLKEKPKIDRLQPARYILATSVSLSPANKDKIIQVLFPHIKRPDAIYGKEDLNNLLGLFPDIEKQHFKLWLSSIVILEEILHSKILNQTKLAFKNITDKSRVYVVNQSFHDAIKILKEYNYVIIAGIPGIGKTTLANMLVLYFRKKNYDFIDVSYDISEAYSMPDRKGPRVYRYDDFLGRTALEEKLRKNEDRRLFDFISSIRKDKNSKLILTTREYILKQAQTDYEILNGPFFEKPQCIVDLSQYTRPIRAQILYNHLYFSKLPKEYIEEIVRQATYLKIVDHPNYNPRIIEYMTDPMWIGSNK
ncbi:MAG: restriction endonuclease, partial [Acidobacteria bacterium]|nr:restriction endonuclease [Acidobacteriota bacterium]